MAGSKKNAKKSGGAGAKKSVSSPIATGGSGGFFEQQVNAYWLVHLLVKQIPPILLNCTVTEVHFQTRHLGWETDDFLVVGHTSAGEKRKLAGQVKRSFTVSSNDPISIDAFERFWKDFNNRKILSEDVDCLALVTLLGTNTLLSDFGNLLDCARASSDSADFEHRMSVAGLLSKKSISQFNDVKKIIEELERKQVSIDLIWRFLRRLHVLSLDFGTSTKQNEAMAKNLLHHASDGKDVDGTWARLGQLSAEGMGVAKSYKIGDLPSELTQAHKNSAEFDQSVLKLLNDHSEPIINGIRTTIGSSLSLKREAIVQDILKAIEDTNVVLISGPAGSGKSGLAKQAFETIKQNSFVACFRAEEFAHPHFDEVLKNAQIDASISKLELMLQTQSKKVIWVESIERLLEHSTRDAFADLLNLIRRDPSWRLILSCRDYSSNLVVDALVQPNGLTASIVSVPQLSDGELAQVGKAITSLAKPLANEGMKKFLRSPYLLDKALMIPWSATADYPKNERDFRLKFWKQVIRKDHELINGLPQRREEAFVEISLRRARALNLFADEKGLDASVIDALWRDSLLTKAEHPFKGIAPAHDALEDWAILHWIDQQYASPGRTLESFAAAIGEYPAIRRAFRKWTLELAQISLAEAETFFESVLVTSSAPGHFRDDALLALLQSPSIHDLLEKHKSRLFEEDKKLLLRVIHLMRVGCVEPPVWLSSLRKTSVLYNVPKGECWAAILKLVAGNLNQFSKREFGLLLGLLEDWAKQIAWWMPYPDGFEAAGVISYWLLPQIDGYRSEDRQKLLKVIAKIPNTDREKFSELLKGETTNGQVPIAEEFQDILFAGLDGSAAARDLPALVIETLKDYLMCKESDLRRDWYSGERLDIETLFGIKDGLSHDFFPESALRGPFGQLLFHHPKLGLDFILELFNHATDWYVHPRVRPLEDAMKVTLTFSDKSERTVWANPRMWNLYRGLSVGPYSLQCVLMALERWLLEVAKQNPESLDKILMRLLRESDSAMLVSVVAGVATAYPEVAKESLKVLLRSKDCIELDRTRMVSEAGAASKLLGGLSSLKAENSIYEDERKMSDALPHRGKQLETAALELQLIGVEKEVQEILDMHLGKLPPAEERSEDQKTWLLALRRMDLRQYRMIEQDQEEEKGEDSEDSKEKQVVLRLEPKEPDADVKAMVQKHSADSQPFLESMSLSSWGHSVFNRGSRRGGNPAEWKVYLKKAIQFSSSPAAIELTARMNGGVGYVAAVCIRDHWQDLTDEQKNWCVERAAEEVQSSCDHWERIERMQRGGLPGDRPCAMVLSKLLAVDLTPKQKETTLRAFACGLTHAIEEVRMYFAAGVGQFLWVADSDLATKVVNALAEGATRSIQAKEAQDGLPYEQQIENDRIEMSVAHQIRESFFQKDGIPSDAYEHLDSSTWTGSDAEIFILRILSGNLTASITTFGFRRIARTLLSWWEKDDERRHQGGGRRERSSETESVILQLLSAALLRLPLEAAKDVLGELLAGIDTQPKEINWVVRYLILYEVERPNTAQFWELWKLCAEKLKHAKWVGSINPQYGGTGEFVSSVFLGILWDDGIKHWRSLEGFSSNIDDLFVSLPVSTVILEYYVRYLYKIGERALPNAFKIIADRLSGSKEPGSLFNDEISVMLCELLQRYVYGRPLELKSKPDLRAAVLLVLDILVESGSSAAFRLRDDFVTPIAVA